MRVIAGSAKGRKLKTLEGRDVRPTTDKVKEAIFSSIHFQLPNAIVLDLFAGSGQLGIEALSRGAKKVIYVDRSARSLAVTKQNLSDLQMSDLAQIYQTEADVFLGQTALSFDIAILDPPYHLGFLEKILPLLSMKMSNNGIVICEHESGLSLPEKINTLLQQKTKKYGAISVTTYLCRKDED